MTLKTTHGKPSSAAMPLFQKNWKSVTTASRERDRSLPEERLLCRPQEGLVQGSGVDAPRVVSGSGEVLHARSEAVHARERVGDDLDHAARRGAVPLECRLNHRDVGRGHGDGELDGTRPGRCETDGEVGVGADVAGGEEWNQKYAHLFALFS
jgi:hypothetical protein